jgi:gas vesicle protein
MSQLKMAQLKGFLSGLFVGALLGAVTMWLMAPKSGKRTRANLYHQYDELRDQVMDGIEETEEQIVAQANRIAKDARSKMKDLRHRG